MTTHLLLRCKRVLTHLTDAFREDLVFAVVEEVAATGAWAFAAAMMPLQAALVTAAAA